MKNRFSTFKSPAQTKIVAMLIVFILFLTIFHWKKIADQITDISQPIPAATIAAPTHQLSPTPSLANFHLFGLAEDRDALPQTALQLTLEGIVFTPQGQASLAIIRTIKGRAKVYRIGQTVPGGATIKGIERNQVILEENNQLASLKLPAPNITSKPLKKYHD